jgi:hypothetical protein
LAKELIFQFIHLAQLIAHGHLLAVLLSVCGSSVEIKELNHQYQSP